MVLGTPGARGPALLAKLLVLAGAGALAWGVEEAVRRSLTAATGLPSPTRDWVGWDGQVRSIERPVEPEHAFGIAVPDIAPIVAAILASWIALGAAWTRK